MRKKYFHSETSPCESQKKNKSKTLRRLNLQDLASAFFILGIGVLLSLFAFSVEQFRRCCLWHHYIMSNAYITSDFAKHFPCNRNFNITKILIIISNCVHYHIVPPNYTWFICFLKKKTNLIKYNERSNKLDSLTRNYWDSINFTTE